MTGQINLDTIEKVKEYIADITHVNAAVDISYGRYVVNGRSIMGIFSLDLSRPLTISMDSTDPEAEKQFARICEKYA